MGLTRFALRNPLVVGATTIMLALFGLYAYFSMRIGIVPNISLPQVTIITVDRGADPNTVETQITKPIEDAVATVANIDQITSSSNEGISSITVQFTTAANIDFAPLDVERAVNSIRSKLPANADPPSIYKFDASSLPVMVVSLSGPQPLNQLQQLAKDRVLRGFETINGVASVDIAGGPTREIHVNVDPTKLRAYNLGFNSVQQALQAEQVETPAGSLPSAAKNVNVRFNGLVRTPADLGNIIVAQQTNRRVSIRDLASIEDSFLKDQPLSRVDGTPAVRFTITKLPNASSLQLSSDLRKVIAEVEPTLPHGVQFTVDFDIAHYTQQSFNTIQKTLGEAVLFTGVILLLFVHTWRSTFIVLISIPTSLLTTFGFMYVAGLNLNLFSMLALTLSVGILVDDSIVVLENIARHMGLGDPPWVAAINGRSEIGLAAITITLVDVAVYLPIALTPGISGEIIRSFALVITCATLTSLLVSFTLTPLLASRYLRLERTVDQRHGDLLSRFGQRWDAGFERMGASYRSLLAKVLTGRFVPFMPLGRGRRGIGARWLVILVGILSLFVGFGALATGRVGFDVFPSGDQSEVDLTVNMPPATNIARTDSAVREIEAKLKAYPEVRQVVSDVGSTTGQTLSSQAEGDIGEIRVLLVPPNERERSAAELADALSVELPNSIPGVKIRTALQNVFGFGGFGGQPIQVAVRGRDPEILNGLVDRVTSIVENTPGAVEVNNANERVQPELVVSVDRDRAADLGVTAQEAAAALRSAVDGTLVAKYRQPGHDDVDIRLMADQSFQATLDNLSRLPLLTTNDTMVSLGQIGTITSGAAPTEIDRVDRDRSVIVNASASGRLVGDVQRDIETQLAGLNLPPGYSITYYGQAEQGGQAFGDVFKAVGVGIILIYVLMMVLFRSLTLPLAVMMSLPLALVGAFSAMAITATPFTLFSMLGFTLLVGLVGKNAILLVDYTDTLRKRGERRTQALLTAGPTRSRPIVMTTMSIIVALLPVAAGVEEGSELLKATAVVLIGGLITSTLLTLVFVPAMYTIFDDIQEFVLHELHKVAKPRQLDPAELVIAHPELSLNGGYTSGFDEEEEGRARGGRRITV